MMPVLTSTEMSIHTGANFPSVAIAAVPANKSVCVLCVCETPMERVQGEALDIMMMCETQWERQAQVTSVFGLGHLEALRTNDLGVAGG